MRFFSVPHTVTPQADWDWAISQAPSVFRLWGQCWRADPYGSRAIKISTDLSDTAFGLARKALAEAKLFEFTPKKSKKDGRVTEYWEVRNLHGARVKNFWKGKEKEESIEEIINETKKSSSSDIHHKNDVHLVQNQGTVKVPEITNKIKIEHDNANLEAGQKKVDTLEKIDIAHTGDVHLVQNQDTVGVLEALSNTSVTPQQHLKDVVEVKEQLPPTLRVG